MLDRLIEYASGLPRDRVGEITLQDIAICSSWHHSLVEDQEELARFATLPDTVDSWLAQATVAETVTEGRRHQWVLRDLIDEVDRGNTRYLAWDELDLLLTALHLARKSNNPNLFARVVALLEGHAERMTARHDRLGVTPRLPALSTRLHVVTEEDIRRAKPREIKMFAGINIQGRGPVLIHRSGHLKVLGSVPENCTLVVEDGSCSVEGFVMGKVAASQNCEVRENISGVVVVRQGNIRARNIIVKAYVVSKWGGVHCRQAEAPDLVFGGSDIWIEQSALMGKFIAPSIHIKSEVFGGLIMVSNLLTAARFRCSDSRGLSIVLRTDLSCQDYGEEPGPEATRLLAKAAGLRRSIGAIKTRIEYTQEEAEQAARNAIVYLTGKDQLHPVAERLAAAGHRLAQVDRIRAVLETLIEVAEDRLEQLARHHGKTVAQELEDAGEAGASLDEMHSDLAQLEAEGGVARDITQELADIAGMRERLVNPVGDVRKLIAALTQVRERLAFWEKESLELEASIAKYEAELKEVFTGKSGTDAPAPSLPTVNLLKRLLTAVRERARSSDDPLVRRLQSSFMQVSIRTVGSRMDRLTQLLASNEELTAQLREVADTLKREYQIAVPVQEHASNSPKVTGCFDAGVKLYADVYLLGDPSPPRGGMIETMGNKESIRTYARVVGKVVAVPPDAGAH